MLEHDHWVRWHDDYEDPRSSLSRRLKVVDGRVRAAISAAPAGPIRLISMCAGQGRDVVNALNGYPRCSDVSARLVELDLDLVKVARRIAADAGLLDVEVTQGDASLTDAYDDVVPANVALVCGVFGNVSDADIHRTIVELPHLCAMGASVIWTRHRRPPDVTPTIRAWFDEVGFEEIAFDVGDSASFGVGTHRYAGPPARFRPNRQMFSFVGAGSGEPLET
jgi:hypothetical protein